MCLRRGDRDGISIPGSDDLGWPGPPPVSLSPQKVGRRKQTRCNSTNKKSASMENASSEVGDPVGDKIRQLRVGVAACSCDHKRFCSRKKKGCE